MNLESIRIPAETMILFEAYSDAERGRLFMAMAAYAFQGKEPCFDGTERAIWPALKQQIDQDVARTQRKKENGRKGGRPRKVASNSEVTENQEKPTETSEGKKRKTENQEKLTETSENLSKAPAPLYSNTNSTVTPSNTYSVNNNIHTGYKGVEEAAADKSSLECISSSKNDKATESNTYSVNNNKTTGYKGVEEAVAEESSLAYKSCGRTVYGDGVPPAAPAAAPQAPETVSAGTDAVKRLIGQYHLPDNATTVAALNEDIERHGLAAVEEAFAGATLADKWGHISINFYRCFLPRATTRASPEQETSDPFLRLLAMEEAGETLSEQDMLQSSNPFLRLLAVEEAKERAKDGGA